MLPRRPEQADAKYVAATLRFAGHGIVVGVDEQTLVDCLTALMWMQVSELHHMDPLFYTRLKTVQRKLAEIELEREARQLNEDDLAW